MLQVRRTPSGPSNSASRNDGGGIIPRRKHGRSAIWRLLYQDESRLEYGRRFWRDPAKRERLLSHWLDARHPYSDRLRERWLPLVDRVLRPQPGHDDSLDAALQCEGVSLRVVVKEIPPVFGSFFMTQDRQRGPSIAWGGRW
jgi:hypothetical protein